MTFIAKRRFGLAAGLVLGLCLSACQSVARDEIATVDMGDGETREAVISVLSQAVGRARIELGPTDGEDSSVIMVLPPPPGPYETNSTAMPIRFDIIKRGERCLAVRRDIKRVYDLPGVTCKPARA